MKKKVFIAAPISGFDRKTEYNFFRQFILYLIDALRQSGFEVCSEVEQISKTENYDSPMKSVNDDFSNILSSDIFLLLHPKKIQSSSLIELGFACANKKVIVLAGKKEDFPYLAKGLETSNIRAKMLDIDGFSNDKTTIIIEAIDSMCL